MHAVHTDADARVATAWAVLDTVPDPELPALSLRDLGIVREVLLQGDALEVVLTPTYSGCPATEVIAQDVAAALVAAGLGPVRTRSRLAPAWSSDWITPQGRDKLRACGIAPPGPVADGALVLRWQPRRIACPRCASLQTERLAAFGSTACKALHRCLDCGEPFEHFKPI